MDAKTILAAKGAAVFSVKPQSPISDAVELMHEKRIGAVLVIDDGDRVRGILSERDIIRVVAEQSCTALQGAVADVMTRDVMACTSDTNAEAVATVMPRARAPSMNCRRLTLPPW